MFVVVEVVRAGVVGDVEVGPVVVVVVGPHALHAEVMIGIVDPGFLGNVFERAVAAIAEEKIGFARQSPGAALDGDAAKLAGLVVTAEHRQLVDVDEDVARDEQVDKSVAIEIAPGMRRC